MIKAKIAYFPVGFFAIAYILHVGYRAEIWWLWAAVIWIGIGIRITNRELGGELFRGIIWSWVWPVYLIKNGIFSHEIYRIEINGVGVGELKKADLYHTLSMVVKTPEIYLEQIREVFRAIVAATILVAVLSSTIVTISMIYIGKTNGQLLVEIVRGWLEQGTIPMQSTITMVLQVLILSLSVAILRNCFSEGFGDGLRLACKRIEKGSVGIYPVCS